MLPYILHTLTEDAPESSKISETVSHDQSSVRDYTNTINTTLSNIIVVSIPNHFIKEDKFKKYVAYTIKCIESHGQSTAERRYSDFEKIRALLVIRWPGCYIPPIPPKKTINYGSKFIEKRRKGLESFCEKVLMMQPIHNSDEYQIFLKDRDLNWEEIIKKFEQPTYEDIITRYSNSFMHLAGKPFNNETVAEIGTFRKFLVKANDCFDVFKKVSCEAVRARKAYYKEFADFHQVVCAGYEKNILSLYHDGNTAVTVFTNPSSESLLERAEQIKEGIEAEGPERDSIEHISEWIKCEKAEVEAFLEAISQRDKYEAQRNKIQEKLTEASKYLQEVNAGKHDIMLVFKAKSKKFEVSMLETKIQNYSDEVVKLGTIHTMITLILAYNEIEKFKLGKKEKYYEVVKVAAKNEKRNLSEIMDYWQKVVDHDNISFRNDISRDLA